MGGGWAERAAVESFVKKRGCEFGVARFQGFVVVAFGILVWFFCRELIGRSYAVEGAY